MQNFSDTENMYISKVKNASLLINVLEPAHLNILHTAGYGRGELMRL